MDRQPLCLYGGSRQNRMRGAAAALRFSACGRTVTPPRSVFPYVAGAAEAEYDAGKAVEDEEEQAYSPAKRAGASPGNEGRAFR